MMNSDNTITESSGKERLFLSTLQAEKPQAPHQPLSIKEILYPGGAPEEKKGLLDRVTFLGNETIDFFKDDMWMAGVVDFISTVSHICSLASLVSAAASEASKFVPYLSILSSPFYLYHSVVEAIGRVKLVYYAARTSRVADAFFWSSKGVGSLGTMLSTIIRPFAGGAAIFGLSQIPAISFSLTYVIPIVLIVMSTVGGGAQGWALSRTVTELQNLKRHKASLDGSLGSLETVLKVMHVAETAPIVPQERYHWELNTKYFKGRYSTSDRRYEAVQERIKALLNIQALPQIELVLKACQALYQALNSKVQVAQEDNIESVLQRIDSALKLADLVQDAVGPLGSEKSLNLGEALQTLQAAKADLTQIKDLIYQEGLDTVDLIYGEVHRNIICQSTDVLTAVITLVAGVLFLAFPYHATAAFALSLGSSVLSVAIIVGNRAITQEKFLQLERALNLLNVESSSDSQRKTPKRTHLGLPTDLASNLSVA